MATETLEDKKLNEEVEKSREEGEKEEDTEMAEKEEGEDPEERESNDEEEEEEEESKKGRGGSDRKASSKEVEEESNKSGGEESKGKSQPRKRKSSVSIEPVTPTERPSRERKIVERYSAPSERLSTPKTLSIEKGHGTQLKDIPNVAFKLSKRKPDENLQTLHTVLFGKRAKVHSLKKNINQFSGFVWVENEEKHRTKIKEKLDKCVKEKLLDFCDVLDIPVSKMREKKEDILAKLVEFLESPHATTEVSLAEKEQLQKNKKQKRKSPVSAGTTAKGASAVQNKKQKGTEKKKEPASKVEEKNEDVEEPESPSEAKSDSDDANDDASVQKEISDQEGSESEEEDKENEQQSKGSGKKKMKQDSKAKSAKSPAKSSESRKPPASSPKPKVSKNKDKKDDEKKSQKDQDTPSKDVTKSDKKLSTPSSKLSGKEPGKGKASNKPKAAPTSEEMHAAVSVILKEVDFNTATLSDILRQLGTHFGVDLTDKKAEVKSIIEDVINNMTDDEEDEEDGNEGDEDARENSEDKSGKENDS